MAGVFDADSKAYQWASQKLEEIAESAGDGQKILKLKVEPLLGEVRRLVAGIRAAQAEPIAPRVTLNGHCSACEFQAGCRQAAEIANDRTRPANHVRRSRRCRITLGRFGPTG